MIRPPLRTGPESGSPSRFRYSRFDDCATQRLNSRRVCSARSCQPTGSIDRNTGLWRVGVGRGAPTASASQPQKRAAEPELGIQDVLVEPALLVLLRLRGLGPAF